MSNTPKLTAISFFAPGHPKGQPRPKAFSRGGHARVYDPGTAEGWKSCVAASAKDHIPPHPLAIPIYLRLDFQFPRPKGHYGTGKKALVLKDSAPLYHVSKPDADNAAKAVMDAMTQLGFWKDDAYVADLRVCKTYGDFHPGCQITIQEL